VAPPTTTQVQFYALNVDESAATMFFDSIEAVNVTASGPLSLAVGQTDSTTFSATYTITEADINAGSVVNTATADSNESDPHSNTETTLLPVDLALDPDRDGFINLFERAFGLDIFNADPANMGPAGTLVEIGGQYHLQLEYRQRTGGSGTNGVDYTADGMMYTVEVSGNLTTWDSGILVVEEAALPVDNGDGTEKVTMRSVAPLPAGGKQFIHLKVTEAP
jgi:hypothetical protein